MAPTGGTFRQDTGGTGPLSSPASSSGGLIRRSVISSKASKHVWTWVIPAERAMDLLFFRRVFQVLTERYSSQINEDGEVPLHVFQRAMLRLFRILRLPTDDFDASKYDVDNSGSVGWWEFVEVWRDRSISLRLTFPERIFLSLEDPSSGILAQFASIVVMGLIVLSSGAFIMSTEPFFRELPPNCPDESCEPVHDPVFDSIETVCVAIFTAEYVIRLAASYWTRVELVETETLTDRICDDRTLSFYTPFGRMWHFVSQPGNVIDLVAVLPYYLEVYIEERTNSSSKTDLTVLRIIRLARIFRAFKLGKYMDAFVILGRAFGRSLKALYVLVFYLLLGVCISSSIMFFLEVGRWDPDKRVYVREVGKQWNPAAAGGGAWEIVEQPTPFSSIPNSFWWCLVTATTVGYGDVVPYSTLGRIFGGVTMVWGLMVLAMPVGVISNNFGQVWADYEEEKRSEKLTSEQATSAVQEALTHQDPAVVSRMIKVEVWDDDGHGREAEFLGRGECIMRLGAEPVEELVLLQLDADYTKANREVQGSVEIEYQWRPSETSPEFHLSGKLKIMIRAAHDLLNVDWKGKSDPFVKAMAFPTSADSHGNIHPVIWRTETVKGDLNPKYDDSQSFVYSWRLEAMQQKQSVAASPLKAAEPASDATVCSARTPRDVDLMPKLRLLEGQVEMQARALESLAVILSDLEQRLAQKTRRKEEKRLARKGVGAEAKVQTEPNRLDRLEAKLDLLLRQLDPAKPAKSGWQCCSMEKAAG